MAEAITLDEELHFNKLGNMRKIQNGNTLCCSHSLIISIVQ